jgi:peptide chain release factor 1
MIDKLWKISDKFSEIDEKLMDPSVVCDQGLYRKLMKERKNLEPIVKKFHEYQAVSDSFQEADQLLQTELDTDFKQMVTEEYFSAKEKLPQLENELKILLLPKDEDDDKSAIVEIRAGVGGEEAMLFAGALFRMYSMYAETHGYKIDILSENNTELGGYKEITFLVEGDGVYSRLKFESGAHRVQRVPETESSGRIHTSAVTVAVLPEADDVTIFIDPKDIEIDTFRSSGAGGQHVNKTSSAIRVTHKPTGLVVECQDERSQFKNKDKALKILRSRLYDQKQKEQADKISAARKDQVGSGDRSERIRTYNFPQGRITDHRIGMTIYKLESFMNGEIDEILEALIANAQAEKLKADII